MPRRVSSPAENRPHNLHGTRNLLADLVEASPDLRPLTKRTWQQALRGYVQFSGHDPTGWTPATADAWRTALLARGLKRQTVNVHIVALKHASRALARHVDDPARDFARHLRAARLTIEDSDLETRRQAVPLDLIQRIIDGCNGSRPEDLCDRALLVFLIRNGVRRAGVAGLRFEDIRRDGPCPAAHITLKGGNRHRLWLDTETVDALDAWLAQLRALGVDRGSIFWSFRNRRLHRPLSPDGVYHVVKTRAAAVGVEITPHVFRHTFISALALAGTPYARIRAVTGQGSDAMINLYTTDTEAPTNPATNVLPRFLTKPTNDNSKP